MGRKEGREAWEDIVEFMAGGRPSECRCRRSGTQPGTEKCIALVYQGEDAVRKIRDVLGPTDPAKAPPGSIRQGIWPDHHDQRRARLRFGREREARNGDRPGRRE